MSSKSDRIRRYYVKSRLSRIQCLQFFVKVTDGVFMQNTKFHANIKLSHREVNFMVKICTQCRNSLRYKVQHNLKVQSSEIRSACCPLK